MPPISVGDPSKPRILCLHGGGVSATIFDLQSRNITARLKHTFRFVFVDAPFLCPPHEDIVDAYGECGPFRRWLGWIEGEHPVIDSKQAARLIKGVILDGMAEDAGTGPWVGVMGFSQGAKIAASLLWAQERLGPGKAETDFRFGVLISGAAPFVMLDWDFPCPDSCESDPGALTGWFEEFPEEPEDGGESVLTIPTLHILGTEDSGLDTQRALRDKYCKPGTVRSIEWEGGHRVPVKIPDVAEVVSEVWEVAEDAGCAVEKRATQAFRIHGSDSLPRSIRCVFKAVSICTCGRT